MEASMFSATDILKAVLTVCTLVAWRNVASGCVVCCAYQMWESSLNSHTVQWQVFRLKAEEPEGPSVVGAGGQTDRYRPAAALGHFAATVISSGHKTLHWCQTLIKFTLSLPLQQWEYPVTSDVRAFCGSGLQYNWIYGYAMTFLWNFAHIRNTKERISHLGL